ncbi:MAG: hypothetical protein VB824_08045, partial [Dehalococcoidia bacterium]
MIIRTNVLIYLWRRYQYPVLNNSGGWSESTKAGEYSTGGIDLIPTPDRNRAAIACVHIPNFMWQVELIRRPELVNRPAIIVGENGSIASKGAQSVLDWSAELGPKMSRGMPLSEALAIVRKDVLLLEPDMPLYRHTFSEVLIGLEARCPDVEPDTERADSYGFGRAYIGIWGLDRLYGDDAHVVRAL